MAKKMNNFFGHCYLSPQIARFSLPKAKRQGDDLAKISFLCQLSPFSWLNSDSSSVVYEYPRNGYRLR